VRNVPKRLILGAVLIGAGEALILWHVKPWSYYYFPVIWYGYIATLDGVAKVLFGRSLWDAHPRASLAMIPLSAAFWWVFELFDQAVDSWRYVNAGSFSVAGYIGLASLCFSTVLLAVWETAWLIAALQDRNNVGASQTLTQEIGESLETGDHDSGQQHSSPRYASSSGRSTGHAPWRRNSR